MAVIKEVKGGKEMRAVVRKIADEYPKQAKRALFRFAERLMTEIKTVPHVPVDLGNLRDTGIVVAAADRLAVTMSFGGPAVDYAVTVHETNKNYRVGHWKYLEQPLMEKVPTMAAELSKDAQLLSKGNTGGVTGVDNDKSSGGTPGGDVEGGGGEAG
jgi:hypothetical protein